MGWLHVYFLVPHFVLFLMVLAVLIAMFLDNTFLPSSKQLSRLCLIYLFVLCVLTGDGDPEGSNPRDIRVRARGKGLWRISDAHCAYDPLHFILFHPHGELGWHPNITSATLAIVDELSSEDE
jgi:hypothetical protein